VVRQPSRPATIVADHPIAQRLPVHACDARGGLPAQPIQRGGDRQQAPGDPRVALDLGQPTQFDRGDVLADQKGGHGRPLDAMHADESRPPASAQAKESAFQPVGITSKARTRQIDRDAPWTVKCGRKARPPEGGRPASRPTAFTSALQRDYSRRRIAFGHHHPACA